MFEVFGRTGPQSLGGPQFRTLQKLTCQFERLWMMFIWRKLPADTRFDLSLDFFFYFAVGIAMLTKEPKMLQPDAF